MKIYGRFLTNLPTKSAPIYDLLHKDRKWQWSSKQDEAFKLSKEALQTDSLLVHFDDNNPLVLTCDASPYGLGAVLSHTMDDGSDQPIAYVSRSLTAAEKGYA